MEISAWASRILDFVVSLVCTTAVLCGALYFARDLLSNWLAQRIKHNFDSQLEVLKSSLSQTESQISILGNRLLNTRHNRIAEFEKRRLEAIETIWSCVIEWSKKETISRIYSVLNYDAISDAIAPDIDIEKIPEIIKEIGDKVESDLNTGKDADQQRPYLTEIVWANFIAYRSILRHAILKMEALNQKLPKKYIKDNKEINELIKKALPYHSNLIDEHDEGAYFHILEDLKDNILKGIRKMLDGDETDKAEISKALDIMKAAESLYKNADSI